MTTAIIGTGNIGGQVARHLVAGGEQVVLAARDESHAAALANELGPLASAASVRQAIAGADVVVLAVWLDTTKELIAENGDLLHGKVVVDPSNPIQLDGKGGLNGNVLDSDEAQAAVAVGRSGCVPTALQLTNDGHGLQPKVQSTVTLSRALSR